MPSMEVMSGRNCFTTASTYQISLELVTCSPPHVLCSVTEMVVLKSV